MGRRPDHQTDEDDIRGHASLPHSVLGTSDRANHHSETRNVHTDIPREIGLLREEIALLRAFLGEEIDLILFGDN
jgi:hypothetical protein